MAVREAKETAFRGKSYSSISRSVSSASESAVCAAEPVVQIEVFQDNLFCPSPSSISVRSIGRVPLAGSRVGTGLYIL
jgi:hypothetical protein